MFVAPEVGTVLALVVVDELVVLVLEDCLVFVVDDCVGRLPVGD